jgi:hypothetical protein
VIPFDKPVRILRTADGGHVETIDVTAHVGNKMLFRITTDVEDGDLVEYDLPSGKTRTVRLTNVRHHQAPAGMGLQAQQIDHISAEFAPAARPSR